MPRAFLGVGSNLGDRHSNLAQALDSLKKIKGISVIHASSVRETAPVGGPPQGKYLNAVWEIQTDLTARHLLNALLELEVGMGRTRSVPNAPRTLDLDILFYDREIVREPGLEIPHPRLHERAFVLGPLSELAPDFVHPVLKKTVTEILRCL